MEYKIISVSNCSANIAKEQLQKEVNKHLQNGWIPHGGVSTYITCSGYNLTYHADQALIRYSSNKKAR